LSSFFIFSFDITDSRTKNSLQDSFLSCLLFFPSQEPQTKRPLLFAFDLKKQGEKSETAYFYPYFARSRTHTGAKTFYYARLPGERAASSLRALLHG